MKNLNFSVKKNLATRAICAGNLASFLEVDVISIERTFEQLVPPHQWRTQDLKLGYAWKKKTNVISIVKYTIR